MKVIRNCRECKGDFEYEPFLIAGVDVTTGLSVCDECSPEVERKREAAVREREAKSEYLAKVPEEYRDTDVNHVNYPIAVHEAAQRWAKRQLQTDKCWLGVIGKVGVGKTRVLSQVARRLIWNGNRLEWATSTEYGDYVETRKCFENGRNSRFWLKRFRTAGVLVFDDLGKQEWDRQMCAQFYDLLEHRKKHKIPLLWSSNLSLEELGEDIPVKQREAILSRLSGMSFVIDLKGGDE